MIPRRLIIAIALVLAVFAAMPRPAQSADSGAAGNAQALRERYQALQTGGDNRFGRPLHVSSSESGERVSGEVHALVNAPFTEARGVLADAAHWCNILLLHLNTKQCNAESGRETAPLSLRIGRKSDQPAEQAYQVNFTWRLKASTADYLQVELTAAQGPMGTSDYRIVLEATSSGRAQTLLRFDYGYGYGMMGQLTVKTYLSTAGRNKFGFTVVGKEPDGSPRHVGGMRGLVERNTMRYYLAIEAWLGAQRVPPAQRMERSLRDWFAACERHARQLHELDEREYLDMKRKEYARHLADAGARTKPTDGGG